MSEEQTDWNTVDVPEKGEFEIEENGEVQEAQPEVQVEDAKPQDPTEEIKGPDDSKNNEAQQRIRQ